GQESPASGRRFRAMPEPTAERTLVKSPPELWAEVSDPEALGRHLEAFGEIRITRLEPETTVAWEGDTASGTVSLAPSGWGGKVPRRRGWAGWGGAVPGVPPDPPPPPDPPVAPAPPPPGLFARLFRRAAPPVIEETVEPPAPVEPPPAPAEPAFAPQDAQDA